MNGFIKLTDATNNTGRTLWVRPQDISCVREETPPHSIIILKGGTRLSVRETPEQIAALMVA